MNDIYSRKGNYPSDNAGTYVPGMHESVATEEIVSKENSVNEDPVVGFLYSVSRKGIGEYWPLHVGTNTIGRASDNDVVLNEMTVSDHHACVMVRQMKSTHKLIASVKDMGSKTGMFLNEEELDYDNHSCKNGDIVTIGLAYRLVILLIDAEEYGLTVSENFKAATSSSVPPVFVGPSTPDNSFDPYNPKNRVVDQGTVDLSGAGIGGPGGTVAL